MDQLLETRQKIYDYFQSSNACREFFFNSSREERLVAYYTSMFLISDATESLLEAVKPKTRLLAPNVQADGRPPAVEASWRRPALHIERTSHRGRCSVGHTDAQPHGLENPA